MDGAHWLQLGTFVPTRRGPWSNPEPSQASGPPGLRVADTAVRPPVLQAGVRARTRAGGHSGLEHLKAMEEAAARDLAPSTPRLASPPSLGPASITLNVSLSPFPTKRIQQLLATNSGGGGVVGRGPRWP